jgi:molybdopterin/thiamine biosynthesis adenylyltransferase
VIEELCRLGVGTIAAFDPDRFEENNLNRQLLCNDRALGTPKVAAARQRARQVNPAVELVAVRAAVGRRNGARLLKGYQVVVDALDSIAGRLELAEVCQALGVPLVHGSVGGWYGQVAVQFPGEQTLPRIYGANGGGRGAEKELGVLAFAPALVASLEAAEACKLLLGVGAPLRGRMLYVDLLAMKVVEARI